MAITRRSRRCSRSPRLKTVLDINSTEFASEPTTVQAGGTLLHEAARKKNKELIQVLLLHGADPFRRDRKGKLPQDVTKDDTTRAMLKRSPAAVAAQRGIQEKAVLGHAASQGASTAAPGDPLAGREAREMKGYLKKWTNYRKGYQLRFFVLEDGVLSYYKHQDDAGSACRGAINMRIAKLYMSPDEKTKFEIIGKSSVKYTLKANHEVEAKRWFWALNNSIQWTKDQAKEDERHRARSAELLRQARAEVGGGSGAASSARTPELSIHEPSSENVSVSERRNSSQLPRTLSSAKASIQRAASTVGSIDDETADFETTDGGDLSKYGGNGGGPGMHGEADDDDDDDEFLDDMSTRDAPAAAKDAFNITAQSARLQLDAMSHVNAALMAEATRSPATPLADAKVAQALSTYDAAIRSLTGLVGDLLRISRDRDAYWQYRLNRETDMRRMWEESMAKVAHEQEELEARVGEAELKRRLTKRALREVMETGLTESTTALTSQPTTAAAEASQATDDDDEDDKEPDFGPPQKSPTKSIVARQQTILDQIGGLSESESEEEEEFFDAVDAGEVEVAEMPPSEVVSEKTKAVVVSGDMDISSSFKGYENGIRKRLKMDADDRPKISLWVRFLLLLLPLKPS